MAQLNSGTVELLTLNARPFGGVGIGGDWGEAGVEPSVTDLILDPIVRTLMARDAVTDGDVWAAMMQARKQIAEGAALQ